jgi:CheY-like chemotaxis protein
VHKCTDKRTGDVMVSHREPAGGLFFAQERLEPGSDRDFSVFVSETMEAASFDHVPEDVLIVEDDPIIALDFEDTILSFGVKTVRTAGSVARALELIADRAPDFALLDVGLVREKSFAIAERLDALGIPFVFVTGYSADVRLPAAFAGRPRLPKPFSTDALHALLKRPAGA